VHKRKAGFKQQRKVQKICSFWQALGVCERKSGMQQCFVLCLEQ
jgi:hypothetical protein